MPPTECDLLLRALIDEPALSSARRSHASHCARCAPLLAVPEALDAKADEVIAIGPALHEALQHASRVRRVSALQRATPTGLVVIATLGTASLLGATSARGWLNSLALISAAAVGFALVFWRGPDGLGSPARWRRGYSFAAAALLLASSASAVRVGSLRSMGASPWSPGTAARSTERLSGIDSGELAATVASCALVTVLSAMVAMLGAHRTTPNRPSLSGSALGAAAALLGLSVSHHGAALPWWAQLGVLATSVAVCSRIGRDLLAP